MCTVSFVKSGEKVIVTSNRDESVIRTKAIPPKEYILNNKKIIFPKDPKAGGTWYAIDQVGTIIVLLNGANQKHQPTPPYRKSRGLIVLDIISSPSAIDEWTNLNLQNIEPFTLVLFQNKQLYQLRWDGLLKDKTALDADKNHIWASATLYSDEIRAKRKELFDSFLEKKQLPTEVDLYQFHRYTDSENNQNGLIINRNDSLKTLSITQSIFDKDDFLIKHFDLINEKEFVTSFYEKTKNSVDVLN